MRATAAASWESSVPFTQGDLDVGVLSRQDNWGCRLDVERPLGDADLGCYRLPRKHVTAAASWESSAPSLRAISMLVSWPESSTEPAPTTFRVPWLRSISTATACPVSATGAASWASSVPSAQVDLDVRVLAGEPVTGATGAGSATANRIRSPVTSPV